MNRNEAITALVNYALEKELIEQEEKVWAVNRILEVMQADSFSWEESAKGKEAGLTEILDTLIDDAYERGVLEENSVVYRDLFDTKLMGSLTPRPVQVMKKFQQLQEESSQRATDWYYQFSQDTNYIRKDRVAKDIRWKTETEYGEIDISINQSKPEKDPKAIAAARNQPASDYPRCMLCEENVGYAGRLNYPARQNHRIVPVTINNTDWYLQYSPYVYYNEHCICFNKVHTPMKIDKACFAKLLDFVRQFNLMFKTFQGVTEDAKNTVYLRPETAQGIFVNFKNVQRTSRKKIPFGIGQVGKSFRNEITPGNFTFRTREFEQMELEFFCEPGTDLEWFQYWRGFCRDWLISLGIKEDEMRLRDHDPAELAFYSKGTTDIEFLFPFGWGELWGIADRTDYDLGRHQETSGQDLTYFDDEKNERYLPYVIEPSLGADRVVLAFLCAAYDEENIGTEEKPDMRTVLHFHPALAPVKIGVLPLSKKLNEGAEKVFAQLSHKYNCEFDDRGNIGKRYRRQDEIGTPFCVTYDFESENDGAVTVRDRDTMEQERIKIEDLDAYFAEKFNW